jgi:hypothetical protein
MCFSYFVSILYNRKITVESIEGVREIVPAVGSIPDLKPYLDVINGVIYAKLKETNDLEA